MLHNADRAEAAVAEAMVLFSTLSTATDVWHAAAERRAGRDPSEQETAAVVRPYLHEARKDLQALLVRLRASRVYAEHTREAHLTTLVRRFSDLMLLHRVSRLLQVMHQRLLSLYPDVTESLVEEARVLHHACDTLLDAADDAFADDLEAVVRRGLVFAARLQRELGRSSP